MLFDFQPDDLEHTFQVLPGTGFPFHTVRVGFEEVFHFHFTRHWGSGFTKERDVLRVFQSHGLKEVFGGGELSSLEDHGMITHISQPSPRFPYFCKRKDLGSFGVDGSRPRKK